MIREDLLRVYFFGGGFSTPSSPQATKKETVTRWKRLSPTGTSGEGGPDMQWEYSDTQPQGEGWESFTEERTVIDPNPPGSEENAATKAAAEEAAKKEQLLARNRRGRSSTILTSPSGVSGPAPTVKPSLLGGMKERLGQ